MVMTCSVEVSIAFHRVGKLPARPQTSPVGETWLQRAPHSVPCARHVVRHQTAPSRPEDLPNFKAEQVKESNTFNKTNKNVRDLRSPFSIKSIRDLLNC